MDVHDSKRSQSIGQQRGEPLGFKKLTIANVEESKVLMILDDTCYVRFSTFGETEEQKKKLFKSNIRKTYSPAPLKMMGVAVPKTNFKF
jgi:hypothetical protein